MRQIRCGVFETNSSSTHSITMCMEDEYKRFENGELLYDIFKEKFVTLEEARAMLRDCERINGLSADQLACALEGTGIYSYDKFFDDDDGDSVLETYEESFTTPKGEKVIAFGSYGYDG